eukprot:gb/GEZN01021191.1/.p1 GENE.gb/GEZN01021191.1/~~gb/GEZN01021191.1/.p1  ORF type:complete len:202 (-),score=38.95 gb/GEZN01021191.1/:23-628(-)
MAGKGRQPDRKSKGGKGSKPQDVWCVIMMGFPGSGKSTISGALASSGWVRVNQDELGSSEECLKVMEKALKHKHSVVLDRCNIHPKERKQWASKAKSLGASKVCLVWMNVGLEECMRRCTERKKHPTLQQEKAAEVIAEFAQGFKAPKPWEFQYDLRYSLGADTETEEGFESIEKNALILTLSCLLSSPSASSNVKKHEDR